MSSARYLWRFEAYPRARDRVAADVRRVDPGDVVRPESRRGSEPFWLRTRNLSDRRSSQYDHPPSRLNGRRSCRKIASTSIRLRRLVPNTSLVVHRFFDLSHETSPCTPRRTRLSQRPRTPRDEHRELWRRVRPTAPRRPSRARTRSRTRASSRASNPDDVSPVAPSRDGRVVVRADERRARP